MENDVYYSPNKKIKIIISIHDIGRDMVRSPKIIYNYPEERIMLDLWDTSWELYDYDWGDQDAVVLELRRYPGDCKSIIVNLDCTTDKAISDYFTCDSKKILSELENYYSKHKFKI